MLFHYWAVWLYVHVIKHLKPYDMVSVYCIYTAFSLVGFLGSTSQLTRMGWYHMTRSWIVKPVPLNSSPYQLVTAEICASKLITWLVLPWLPCYCLPCSTVDMTINVLDYNDNAPVFTGEPYTPTVTEVRNASSCHLCHVWMGGYSCSIASHSIALVQSCVIFWLLFDSVMLGLERQWSKCQLPITWTLDQIGR